MAVVGAKRREPKGLRRAVAFGAEASELMAAVQAAMLGNLPYTSLRDALFTHLTAAEGLTLLLASARSDR